MNGIYSTYAHTQPRPSKPIAETIADMRALLATCPPPPKPFMAHKDYFKGLDFTPPHDGIGPVLFMGASLYPVGDYYVSENHPLSPKALNRYDSEIFV